MVNCANCGTQVREYSGDGDWHTECENCGQVIQNGILVKDENTQQPETPQVPRANKVPNVTAIGQEQQMLNNLTTVCQKICNEDCNSRTDWGGYDRSDEEMEQICRGCEVREIAARWGIEAREKGGKRDRSREVRRKITDGVTVGEIDLFSDKITGMNIFIKLMNSGLEGELLKHAEVTDLLENNNELVVTFKFGGFALWIYRKARRYFTGITQCRLYFILEETDLAVIIEKLKPLFTECYEE